MVSVPLLQRQQSSCEHDRRTYGRAAETREAEGGLDPAGSGACQKTKLPRGASLPGVFSSNHCQARSHVDYGRCCTKRLATSWECCVWQPGALMQSHLVEVALNVPPPTHCMGSSPSRTPTHPQSRHKRFNAQGLASYEGMNSLPPGQQEGWLELAPATAAHPACPAAIIGYSFRYLTSASCSHLHEASLHGEISARSLISTCFGISCCGGVRMHSAAMLQCLLRSGRFRPGGAAC